MICDCHVLEKKLNKCKLESKYNNIKNILKQLNICVLKEK